MRPFLAHPGYRESKSKFALAWKTQIALNADFVFFVISVLPLIVKSRNKYAYLISPKYTIGEIMSTAEVVSTIPKSETILTV